MFRPDTELYHGCDVIPYRRTQSVSFETETFCDGKSPNPYNFLRKARLYNALHAG
jgi:hypothetical protein